MLKTQDKLICSICPEVLVGERVHVCGRSTCKRTFCGYCTHKAMEGDAQEPVVIMPMVMVFCRDCYNKCVKINVDCDTLEHETAAKKSRSSPDPFAFADKMPPEKAREVMLGMMYGSQGP